MNSSEALATLLHQDMFPAEIAELIMGENGTALNILRSDPMTILRTLHELQSGTLAVPRLQLLKDFARIMMVGSSMALAECGANPDQRAKSENLVEASEVLMAHCERSIQGIASDGSKQRGATI